MQTQNNWRLCEVVLRSLLCSETSQSLAMVVILAVTCTVRSVDAQCGTTYTSLEARIHTAESVYYGRIASLERTVIVPRNGKAPQGNWTIPDGVVRYTLTIDVDETLKGNQRRRVQLVAQTSDYDRRHRQWRDLATTFIFFVQHPDQAEGRKPIDNLWPPPWTYLRLENPAPAERKYSSAGPPLFSHDGTVLRESAEVLDRARKFARAYSDVGATHSSVIPHRMAGRCSPPCDINFLVMPMVPELERTAKRMLLSPEQFIDDQHPLDTITRMQLVEAGIAALRHFKSDENAAMLKSLLDDPTTLRSTYDHGRYKGMTVLMYPIRAAAWDVLRRWGHEFPRPVTERVIAVSIPSE